MSSQTPQRAAFDLEPGLRFASAKDAPALTRLINAAFNPVESFFLTGNRIDEAQVRQYLEHGRYMVLDSADGLAACVYAKLRGDRAYIGMLSVAPGCQKSGLGRRLMIVAEDYCRAHGCTAVDLRVVNRRVELLPMYVAMGYVKTGTEPIPQEALQYFKLPCHFITMSKTLGAMPPKHS